MLKRRARSTTSSLIGADRARDRLEPLTVDHLEFYVGNPAAAARLWASLGFAPVATQDRATGVQDLVSYVMQQGSVRLLLTGGTTPRIDAVQHVAARGDSIKDVAWNVADADGAYGTCIAAGVEPIHLPVAYEDEDGRLELCPIESPAGLLHTLIDRSAYTGAFCPGYIRDHRVPVPPVIAPIGVTRVESLTFVVHPNTLAAVTAFYRDLLGFQDSGTHGLRSRDDVTSALRVLRNGVGLPAVVLMEPRERIMRSHLDEFLRLHAGPGVQIVGLRVDSLDAVIERVRREGLPSTVGDGPQGESVERSDGADVRSLIVGPLQPRAPLYLEFIEHDGDAPVVPLEARSALNRVLDAKVRSEAERPVLGTWESGR